MSALVEASFPCAKARSALLWASAVWAPTSTDWPARLLRLLHQPSAGPLILSGQLRARVASRIGQRTAQLVLRPPGFTAL